MFLAGLLVGAMLSAIGLPRGALLWRAVRADDAEMLHNAEAARVISLNGTAGAPHR